MNALARTARLTGLFYLGLAITGGLGFHDAASLIGAAVVPTSSGNTARQLMLMRDLRVTAFAATPSYSITVAEVAAAEGVDLAALPLRSAFVGAEPMSAAPVLTITSKSSPGAPA